MKTRRWRIFVTLFVANEILGLMLATMQNVALYLWLVRTAREKILDGVISSMGRLYDRTNSIANAINTHTHTHELARYHASCTSSPPKAATLPDPSFSTFVMFGAVILIFYFMMIRPQQKRAKEHQALLSSIKKG